MARPRRRTRRGSDAAAAPSAESRTPQVIDFGHGKAGTMPGTISASIAARGPAWASMLANQTPSRSMRASRASPAERTKPVDGRVRRAHPWPLALFCPVRPACPAGPRREGSGGAGRRRRASRSNPAPPRQAARGPAARVRARRRPASARESPRRRVRAEAPAWPQAPACFQRPPRPGRRPCTARGCGRCSSAARPPRWPRANPAD